MFSMLPSSSVSNASLVTEAGRQFYVVPTTGIVPGVLPGSKGPGLYERADIAKDFDAWNGIPAVVYHPSEMGNNVSAQHKGVLKRSCVGFLRNTRIRDDGSLQFDVWFDAKRTAKVDTRVMDAVKNGSKMEVSTGLYTDQVQANGQHNGKDYTWKAKNFVPDHLAILPDQRGACSLADGCGLNVNEWSEEARQAAAMTKEQHTKAAKKRLKAALYASAEGNDEVAKSHEAVANMHLANANPNHDAKGLFAAGSGFKAGNDDENYGNDRAYSGLEGRGNNDKTDKFPKTFDSAGFLKALSKIPNPKTTESTEDAKAIRDTLLEAQSMRTANANPNHDEHGRFASGTSAGSNAASKASSEALSVSRGDQRARTTATTAHAMTSHANEQSKRADKGARSQKATNSLNRFAAASHRDAGRAHAEAAVRTKNPELKAAHEKAASAHFAAAKSHEKKLKATRNAALYSTLALM